MLDTPSRRNSMRPPAPNSVRIAHSRPQNIFTVVLMLAYISIFATIAAATIPYWQPYMVAAQASFMQNPAKALSRATALWGYGALWLSMGLGMLIGTPLARLLNGVMPMYHTHRLASMLALQLALFHVVVLTADTSGGYVLHKLLVPFTTSPQFWAPSLMGQTALYGMGLIVVAFYARKRIGARVWKLLHGANFVLFAAALGHSVMAKPNQATAELRPLYVISAAALVLLLVYRIWVARRKT